MTDVLDVLDRAIDELKQKRRQGERTSREANAAGTATGTPNPLKTTPVPAVPAVPVGKDDASAEHPIASTIEDRSAINASENAPEVYLFQNTGSTGITGTLDDFCASRCSRAPLVNGKYGNSPSDDSGPKSQCPPHPRK